ncbi:MAG: spoIIIJ-associated protein [Deferribacteres bacterium]|jgi:spoIIIJ-associated protein|nr:single-stranded nucleic acid binding protein [Deferribacteraceae bacterium]MDK2793216.1 spoIIIJ-associated protein [Deferribacteres bacterium]
MKYFEIEALSIDEAIDKVVSEHKFPKEFIEAEAIEEGSKGFLGIGKKNGLYKVKVNDYEFLKRKIRLTLTEILEKMGITDFRIELMEDYPVCKFNIISEDSNILIGKTAQTLNAIQHIIDKIFNLEDDADNNFVVDVENYRERILTYLKEKATSLAANVLRTGKPAKMPPMVTMIRKEIHMAVKSIKGVKTESYGNGDIKTLYIVPERAKKRREKR